MRILSLIAAAFLLSVALINLTFANVNAIYLTVAALDDRDVHAVRSVKELNGEYYIGVFGGKPFLLKLQSSYPIDPVQTFVATTEGKLLAAEEGMVQYQCDYLVPYWGLAIMVYEDGYAEGFPFRVGPAWKLDQVVPEVFPEIIKPESDNQEVSALIESWWVEIVVQADQEWREARFETQ